MEKYPKYLVIPDRGWEDIRLLFSLSVDQLEAVSTTVRSKENLQSAEASYQLVARATSMSNREALAVLSAITNLTLQRQRYELSNEQLLHDLEIGLPNEFKPLDQRKKDAILTLLSDSQEGYLLEKAERLQVDLIPHLVSARSICDVRPIFDKSRENIEGVLLVALLGLTTHNQDHDEETFVVQLTRSDLKKLRECLEEADKKMSIMEKKFGEGSEIYF